MDQVMSALSQKYDEKITLVKIAAEKEDLAEFAEANDVGMVPTVVLFFNSSKLEMVEGVKPSELIEKIDNQLKLNHHGENGKASPLDTQEKIKAEIAKLPLFERLKTLINSSKVMVFMKGVPDEPKCKFSRALMEILKEEKIQFGFFNILDDNEVREGLKEYSNWKTYPQVYCNEKLIGGLDAIKELKAAGKLAEELTKAVKTNLQFNSPTKSSSSPPHPQGNMEESGDLDSRLKALTHRSQVMLFMKGSPTNPQCGFSNKIVNILKDNDIEFESFDILKDQQVREGLKKFSNWPTYPQLYVNGELIGGLDIVEDLTMEGDLKEELGLQKDAEQTKEQLNERLKKLINSEQGNLYCLL